MGNTKELIQARDDLLAILDEKLKNVPEWRVFRFLDKQVMDSQAISGATGAVESRKQRGRGRRRAGFSYVDLGLEAMEITGAPVTTPEMVDFISARRKLVSDPKKARINIQSALSKDERIRSVPWRGGRAWWYANREPPRDESAGSSLRL
jgi:hypothetical protein